MKKKTVKIFKLFKRLWNISCVSDVGASTEGILDLYSLKLFCQKYMYQLNNSSPILTAFRCLYFDEFPFHICPVSVLILFFFSVRSNIRKGSAMESKWKEIWGVRLTPRSTNSAAVNIKLEAAMAVRCILYYTYRCKYLEICCITWCLSLRTLKCTFSREWHNTFI